MKKTRRWLLMFAALVGLMAHSNALRATSLIFGKSSTTTTSKTTTTEEAPTEDELITDEPEPSENGTTSKLTGIPQIDYIWDPNLPRELNGFNLSDYPFLVTVPDQEDIDFKCDDSLHDGFYASIKYNCQLYHQCLYGVRYDFLCANFTAFDQKTFICHFVSEVDCKNSAKYYFRNDALYKATTTSTTTTLAPPTTTTIEPATPPRPLSRPRRPGRPYRRRPADYYYDDDVDEYEEDYEEPPPRKRKQRPRKRRPEYEEDYPTNQRGYEDRYNRREPPAYANDRGRNRQEDEDYVYDRRGPATDRPRNRNKNSDRRINDEVENKRKPIVRDYDDSKGYEEEDRPEKRFQNGERRKNFDNERRFEERRPQNTERRKYNDERRTGYDDSPRRSHPRDDYESDERPAKRPHKDDPQDEPAVQVKPSGAGGSIFDRPRVPPKIRRPVPVNERTKYDYTTPKTIVSNNKPAAADQEYYDDYEDAPLPKPKQPPVREKATPPPPPPPPPSRVEKKPPVIEPKRTPPAQIVSQEDEYYEDDYEERPKVPPPKQNVREPIENPKQSSRVNVGRDRERNSSRDPFRTPALKNYQNNDDSHEIYEPRIPQQPKPRPPPAQQNQKFPSPPERDVFRDKNSNTYLDHSDSEYTVTKPKYNNNNERDRYNSKENLQVVPKEYNYKSPPARSEQLQPRDQYRQQQDREQYHVIEREPISREENYKSHSQNSDSFRPSMRAPYDYPMNRPTSNEDERIREVRPIVRVVKRPFLPSRGGSPYLPRGLQPVGGGTLNTDKTTTEASPVDVKANLQSDVEEYGEYEDEPFQEPEPPKTTSKPQQFQNQREQQQRTQDTQTVKPIVKGPQQTQFQIQQQGRQDNYDNRQQPLKPTQPPQNNNPKSTLDEIYDSEYDVTLNDALNPTLKPLTPSRGSPIGFSLANKFERSRLPQYTPAELTFSPSQLRRTAIRAPISVQQHPFQHQSRTPVSSLGHYDEYDY